MRRIDIGELADQPWCPAALRDGVRDYLRLLGTVGRIYEPAVPWLVRALEQSGATALVDLGAGTGGPWHWLHPALERALGRPVEVVLTDARPASGADGDGASSTTGRVRALAEPIDARSVPSELRGVRTLFAAFHHFEPGDARAVLADAVRSRQPIVIVEPTKRALGPVLAMLSSPVPAFALTPWLRPVRATRLALTYLLPVIPLAISYDGVASCLRSYTPAELRELARAVAPEAFEWHAGEIPTRQPPFVPLTYLVGLPRSHGGT